MTVPGKTRIVCQLKEHGPPLALLLLLAAAVRLLTALPMQRPGYMDAAYYVDGALSLFEGRGFQDPFVWNYLDDPGGIPHPSHLYWMPLSSVLGYLSFLCFGPTYRAAQVPFALLSLLLPVISYGVAYGVRHQRWQAVCAGLLAIFGGFYMPYWVTPDSFAPFGVVTGLSLWAAGRASGTGRWPWFAVAGGAAGLAHLARADGVLVLLAALFSTGLRVAKTPGPVGRRGARPRGAGRAWLARLAPCAVLVASYLVVMGPWLLRNVSAIGRPLPTAGAQTVWLTDYDDLYSYGRPPTVRSYLDWGWGNVVRSKLRGLWMNAQTVLVVGWMIFFAPFGLVGVWRLRHRAEFEPAWAYGALLYAVMSLLFTFPGWRGGMLHSLSGLLPFMYAAAVEGLGAGVRWVARWRPSWEPARAARGFGALFCALAAVLSVALHLHGLEKYRGTHVYQDVGGWLRGHAPPDARVLVNDPATFYYHARRECLSIPNEDLDTVLAVMERYGAAYLVLDGQHAKLRSLYEAPDGDARLALRASFEHRGERVYLMEWTRIPVAEGWVPSPATGWFGGNGL